MIASIFRFLIFLILLVIILWLVLEILSRDKQIDVLIDEINIRDQESSARMEMWAEQLEQHRKGR